MVKKMICTAVFFALFILTSCDSGLMIVGLYVSEYPDRRVYVCGQDNEIDLSGLEVTLQTAEGTEHTVPYGDSEFDFRFIVNHDVDFDTPGVYTVHIGNGEFYCRFPVEVITDKSV